MMCNSICTCCKFVARNTRAVAIHGANRGGFTREVVCERRVDMIRPNRSAMAPLRITFANGHATAQNESLGRFEGTRTCAHTRRRYSPLRCRRVFGSPSTRLEHLRPIGKHVLCRSPESVCSVRGKSQPRSLWYSGNGLLRTDSNRSISVASLFVHPVGDGHVASHVASNARFPRVPVTNQTFLPRCGSRFRIQYPAVSIPSTCNVSNHRIIFRSRPKTRHPGGQDNRKTTCGEGNRVYMPSLP